MRSRPLTHSIATVSLLSITSATIVDAAPTLRKQVDQHGDFALIGNTLGWDCAVNSAAVLTGTVDCAGVTNTSDTAIDIYFRTDTLALASPSVSMSDASSTAVLELPSGAKITYARLYWGAYQPAGGSADNEVTLSRPGTDFSEKIHANATDVRTANVPDSNGNFWYQGSADVTSQLVAQGTGAYRTEGVSSVNGLNTLDSPSPMAGWALVVFYERESEPTRNLTLFDGFDAVGTSQPQSATLSGFFVPQSGYTAKLGVLAYEGDEKNTGDQFLFNGTVLSDDLNPANNFFNGTRSDLGKGVSALGDLPRLAGTAGSMGGMDVDVIDITRLVKKGDTSATIRATSTADRYVLGALMTSISTYQPDFSTSGKSVRDVNGGALRPGDILEYTVKIVNSGNDRSINTTVRDELPSQVSYVSGSLALVKTTVEPLTDGVDSDAGQYDSATRTVTVHVGAGANGTTGGAIAVGDSVIVKFRVKLNATASGTINNQAFVVAEGERGAPQKEFPTDGNGDDDGVPPTSIVIDHCSIDSECSAPKPFCDLGSSPHTCVACVVSDDCKNATIPDCNPTTHVCECALGAGLCHDADHDGMSDELEVAIGTDPNDADSDDDGLLDGSEVAPDSDTDGDGLINALDPDSDDDGIFDGTESGLGCSNAGTARSAKRCIKDGDGGMTTTNPLQADTDGGGKSDGSEDGNRNGVVDSGESVPNIGYAGDDAKVADSDDDGLTDLLESSLGSDAHDADTDDDGIIDGLEPNPSDDGDLDNHINVLDPDSDDDGIFDGTELGYGCKGPGTIPSSSVCIADADAGQSRTFAVVADTDKGGRIDGDEDRNHDGRVDRNERDPNVSSDDKKECYADVECGTTNSGRVCNAIHTCIDGCRGLGGNGCPTPFVCTSSNDTIGYCDFSTGAGGTSGLGGQSNAGGTVNVGGHASLGGTSGLGGQSNAGGTVNVTATSLPSGGVLAGGGTAAFTNPAGGATFATFGSTETGGTHPIFGAAGAAGKTDDNGKGGGGDSAKEGQGNDGQVAGSAGEVQVIGRHTLEGGGCSCAVPVKRGNGSTWWFAIGAALLFWRRRKAV